MSTKNSRGNESPANDSTDDETETLLRGAVKYADTGTVEVVETPLDYAAQLRITSSDCLAKLTLDLTEEDLAALRDGLAMLDEGESDE